MWGKYPFKAISVADRKIAGLDRFKLVIEIGRASCRERV